MQVEHGVSTVPFQVDMPRRGHHGMNDRAYAIDKGTV
jgi:hypothetical protein